MSWTLLKKKSSEDVAAFQRISVSLLKASCWTGSSRFKGCLAQLSMNAKVRFLPMWNLLSRMLLIPDMNHFSSWQYSGRNSQVLVNNGQLGGVYTADFNERFQMGGFRYTI